MFFTICIVFYDILLPVWNSSIVLHISGLHILYCVLLCNLAAIVLLKE